MQYTDVVLSRFWSRTEYSPSCWVWNGGKGNLFGHRQIRSGRVHLWVHRLSWHIHNGPIPAGMCVLHKCDNPACVNPDHLFLGTKTDNHKDMQSKGRIARGETSGRAKLSLNEVVEIRERTTQGELVADIVADYGHVHPTGVYNAARKRTWKHV